MAQRWNSKLHVVHVIDLNAIREMESAAEPSLDQLKTLDVSSTLETMLKGTEYHGDSTRTTLYGNPDTEILTYANERKIDFVVMGSHGRKGLDRVLIGSTTASVVRRAQIPIITLCERPGSGQE
jgi:nucleotide-binding universal stress UspA family protein